MNLLIFVSITFEFYINFTHLQFKSQVEKQLLSEKIKSLSIFHKNINLIEIFDSKNLYVVFCLKK